MTTAHTQILLGSITLAGIAICVVTLVALQLLPTGLSFLHNPVSQYGITKYKLGYRIQTVAMGIAAICAAVGINEVDVQGCTLVVVLLSLCGAARLAISWFSMDAPEEQRTKTGRRHGLLALVAFGSASIGALRLASVLSSARVWTSSTTAISFLGILMIASVIGMGAVRRSVSGRRYFGLVERVFYVGAIAFFSIIGAQLVSIR